MKVIQPVDVTYGTPSSGFSRASAANYFDHNFTLQQAPANTPRINWNPETGQMEGLLLEPAMTNLLLNTETLSTQSATVISGQTYTLSFYGTGTVTLSNATTTSLTGTGSFPTKRNKLSFTAVSNTLTVTVSGSVQKAQLERHTTTGYTYPTSYLASGASQATRAADVIATTGSDESLYGVFLTDFPNTEAEYNAGTTYALNDVIYYKNRRYRSLVAGNVGNTPDATTSVEEWLDIGPSNPYAAFDEKVSTISQSSKPNDPRRYMVLFVKRPTGIDPIDSVGCVELEFVNRVRCGISSLTNNLYTTVIGSASKDIGGDEETAYFTANSAVTGRMVVTLLFEFNDFNLPDAFTGPSVGEIVVGANFKVGTTNYGLSFGITDYSKKETDEFGNVSLLKRANKKTVSATVDCLKSNVNNTTRRIRSLLAVPTLWSFSDDSGFDTVVNTYGIISEFQSQINYPTFVTCSVQIEEIL